MRIVARIEQIEDLSNLRLDSQRFITDGTERLAIKGIVFEKVAGSRPSLRRAAASSS